MMLFVAVALTLLVLLAVVQMLLLLGSRNAGMKDHLSPALEQLGKGMDRMEAAQAAGMAGGRAEAAQSARQLREELALYLSRLAAANEDRLEQLRLTIETRLTQFQQAIAVHSKEERQELRENLALFKQELHSALREFGGRQADNFNSLKETQQLQQAAQADKLSTMSGILEKSLRTLQDDNAARLEQMRVTVEEKLEKTLESRLAKSFEQVSKNLESVQKGLGEMQQLATGVGDLRKVLTNVKTRGVLGEYQLANLLEQLLTPDQYGVNVKTKPGTNALVEFAIRLPGADGHDQPVWLPVDAKFPKEDFELLCDAYDTGDAAAIEQLRKAFSKGIRKCASDIYDKYIEPPHTTDFGILFLPFESLYAEVLRTPGLFELVQREYRITITGPTTLSALLNSLQMGFRTLAISRRSGEVWHTLAAVKTEFGNFGKVLEQTQKKIQEAGSYIDKASVRSRAIERKLKDVQLLGGGQPALLPEDLLDGTGER